MQLFFNEDLSVATLTISPGVTFSVISKLRASEYRIITKNFIQPNLQASIKDVPGKGMVIMFKSHDESVFSEIKSWEDSKKFALYASIFIRKLDELCDFSCNFNAIIKDIRVRFSDVAGNLNNVFSLGESIDETPCPARGVGVARELAL